METKKITLEKFEHNSREYYCEALVNYSINIESGDYDTPSSSNVEIEEVEITELKVYNSAMNDYQDSYLRSVIKAVTEDIKSNFEV